MQNMICGIDEAGRGPVLGPLVIAGVMISDEQALLEMNVRDSKLLKSEKRIELAGRIRKVCDVELIMVTAMELDILRQVFSLNELEARAFVKLIHILRPDSVYVDCVDTDEDSFHEKLVAKLDYSPKVVSKHKADDIYPVVSAASIIAKTVRDAEVERISRDIGADPGSGYPSDPKTIEFVSGWLEENGRFPPHTRHSWKTTSRLWEDYRFKPTRLDEF